VRSRVAEQPGLRPGTRLRLVQRRARASDSRDGTLDSAIRDLEALRPVLPASACWPTNDPPDTLIDR